ncbi:hypothetical protein [Jatrophihabitans fulvus]
MTYSLVNMPVLGFDLCRLAGGTELADILLGALRLEEHQLRDLAAVPRGPRPRPAAVPAVTGVLRAMRDEPDPAEIPVRAVRTLETSMLGDFDALVRLVRDDILSWTWHESGSIRWQHPDAVAAVDVIVDLLADHYGHGYGTAPAADGASGPAGPDVPHITPGAARTDDLDLGPRTAEVLALLDAIASFTPAQLAVLRAAAGDDSRPAWAAAVHDASWAVYLAGRLRPAAAAQLLTVRAFAAAGLTARDGAYGVWNVLSGAVQATVVADLLGEDAATRLTATLHKALAA